MKKHFAIFLFVVLAIGTVRASGLRPGFGNGEGCLQRRSGQLPSPMESWSGSTMDNGQKYTLKTNKKGEYFSLGITPGKYNVRLFKNADDQKADKEMDHVNGFQVQLDENDLPFDVKKEQENAAKGQGLSPEQLKQMQEAQAKQAEGNEHGQVAE